ncbi:hypothetical protein K501DRAFT_266250 [Backusella circina FSU 941]|nr:hypothetical protein K501DRAFT_266250 [Backusella circina FSU 941]
MTEQVDCQTTSSDISPQVEIRPSKSLETLKTPVITPEKSVSLTLAERRNIPASTEKLRLYAEAQESQVNNLFRLNLPKSSKGVYRPTSIVTRESDDDDDGTDDGFEPLSLVEQTDSQFISAITLDQSMCIDRQEDEKERDNEPHSHHSRSSDEEEEEEEQIDHSHLLLSDGSISPESDLLGDY